jgi:hypothetical protein
MKFAWQSAALGAVALSLAVSNPAYAGPAELALLSSYIGEWNGSSALVGGAQSEPFSCRLTINKGNQAKINYAGRCTLASMNLSVTGTIAFDDASQTYQAIMGSNAGYKGVAIGRVTGETIVFDLAEQEADRAGNAVRLGARITLIGSDSITVDYEVEFNDSDQILTAKVPFTK